MQNVLLKKGVLILMLILYHLLQYLLKKLVLHLLKKLVLITGILNLQLHLQLQYLLQEPRDKENFALNIMILGRKPVLLKCQVNNYYFVIFFLNVDINR